MNGPAPSDEAAHAAEQMILDSRHGQLDAIDAAAADSAALIAAARFLRERALEEGEIRRRGDSLERLLKGEAPTGADVLRQVQPPLRLVVGALRPQLEGQAQSSVEVLRKFLALTQEALAVEGRPLTITLKDMYVIAIQSLGSKATKSGEEMTANHHSALTMRGNFE